jgi:porin
MLCKITRLSKICFTALSLSLTANLITAQECAPCAESCLCEQPYLTGDWHGIRTCHAESGLTYHLNLGQFYYGVASGGLDQQFEYAGHGDYLIVADMDKLVGMKGNFVKVRAEHRFGQSIGSSTGAFIPPTIATDLPIPDDDRLFLTTVSMTQMFSETFGVFMGKMDTLDGDMNAFAHGRGMTGFSNFSLVANPIALRVVPYSTLAAGFVVLQDLEPVWTFAVMNARNTIESDGLSELFAEGCVLSTEVRLPTSWLGRPGHQLFGANWSSREVVELGQDPRFLLPNVPIARASGSWSAYYNFDHYLVVDPNNPKQGWGLFGRAGASDQDTNPLAYFLSAGIGGNSWIVGREQDTFGVGWFQTWNSNQIGPLLTAITGPLGNGQGVELFYNYAVTPWFHLTPDVQVIVPSRENIDTALLVGLRGVLTF